MTQASCSVINFTNGTANNLIVENQFGLGGGRIESDDIVILVAHEKPSSSPVSILRLRDDVGARWKFCKHLVHIIHF